MNQSLSKTLIIVVLIIVVAVVILLKNQPAENEKVTGESSGLETVAVPLESTKDLILSEKEEKKQPKTESEEQTETVKEEPEIINQEVPTETEKTIQSQTQTASGDVLAIVEGEEITEKELESEYEKLSSQYKDMFKNDKDLYLEQLIIKQLLVQKATEKGYIPAGNSSQSQEDTGIQQLICRVPATSK